MPGLFQQQRKSMTQPRAMSFERHILFWIAIVFVFVLLLWLFNGVLGPFLAGMAIAYFLDPVTDKIEARGVPRGLAAFVIVLLFFALGVGLLFLLLPMLEDQVAGLVSALPGYIERLRQLAAPYIHQINLLTPEAGDHPLADAVGKAGGTVAGLGADLAGKLLGGGAAIINIFSLAVLTPVVAFYLLRDWDRLIATVDGLLPVRFAPTLREECRKIDTTLAGFVRGQAMVCLIQAAYYGIGLSAAGLSYGLVIGLLAGFLSFIPYVGAFIGFGLSMAVAFGQFDDLMRVAIVAGVFFLGQAIEGNFLTPKLVGDRVGLHPVWVMFALLAGGSLLGFAGVLVAVPIAAVIGVVTRFLLRNYRESDFYTASATPVDKPTEKTGDIIP